MTAADITRHLKREVNEGGVRRRREEEEGGVRTWEDVRHRRPVSTVTQLTLPSYLLLIGRADVEAGDHDGGSWHQVDFGVGGAVVS